MIKWKIILKYMVNTLTFLGPFKSSQKLLNRFFNSNSTKDFPTEHSTVSIALASVASFILKPRNMPLH